MANQLPPLNALKAFAAVARLGSVRQAAQDLRVNHSAVARHVRTLEAWLGVKLLALGPKGAVLTEDGRRYFDRVQAALDEVAAATASLRPGAVIADLLIWCSPGLAARWLTSRLEQLRAVLRDREIVLRPTAEAPNLPRGDADVSVRYETEAHAAAGVQSEVLARPRFFPVASPEFIEAHGAVTTVAELAALPLVHEVGREQWRVWFGLAGLAEAETKLHGPRVWTADLAVSAALAGQGVALTNGFIAGEDLAAGRLVELLATGIRLGCYRLSAAEAHWADPAITRLRAWFREALAEGGH